MAQAPSEATRTTDALATRPPLSFSGNRFQMFVLDELAARYEKQYSDVIRLTLGKSELPPPEPVVAAMLAAAADYAKASLVYPHGLPLLRERLSAEYAAAFGTAIPVDRFVIGTGTSALFHNLHQLLTGPGDEVVVPLPYYPLYVFTARLAGATVRYYRVDQDTLRIDLDSLREAVTDRTRVVIVNSPGNPLGNIVTEDELLAVDAVIDGRAVLVSDEVYSNVQFDDPRTSAVQLAGELRSPLVVTSSFSKAHRMYARRVGYAIVPEQLIEPLVVTQHHTLLTADPVSQFGAVAALDHQDGVELLTKVYGARRSYTLERFAAVPSVRALPSRGGFYLTLDCADFLREHGIENTVALAELILERTHVATVPGSDFGLPAGLRLSFSAAGYDEAIDRLVGFFTGEPDR